MDRLVIDASVALAWAFEDEPSPVADAVFNFLDAGVALVPALFWIEVANGTLMAERRGRLTDTHTADFTATLENLPIQEEPMNGNRVLREVRLLAESNRLTVYDALYLNLAMRERLPLATLDDALIRAAASTGVTIFSSSGA